MAEKTDKTLIGDLLKLLGSASQADLDSITAEIVAKEAELDNLRQVRKLVADKLGVSLGGKRGGRKKAEPVAAATPASPASSTPATITTSAERRVHCARYVMKNGPTPAADLCRLFSIPLGSQSLVFDHEYFRKTDRGIDVTAKGRAAMDPNA